jgi:hypothetical protein
MKIVKTVNKKWRKRCRNAKAVGKLLAMGGDLRGLMDLLARFECINPVMDCWSYLQKNTFLRFLSPNPPFF